MSIYRMRTQFSKLRNPIIFAVAAVFILGAAFQFGPATWGGRSETGDATVIAKVNGREITADEFERVWMTAQENARSQGVHSMLTYADIRASVFQQMVNDLTLLDAAEKMGVDVSEKKVDQEIDKYVVEYLEQARVSVLGPDVAKKREKIDPRKDKEFKKALADMGRSVKQLEDGALYNLPRKQVQAQLAQQGLIDELKAKEAKVTDKDIKESYDVYSLRQIVLYKMDKPEEQVKSKAEKVAKEAKDGKDFVELVKANSDAPDKDKGGLTEYSFDSRWAMPTEVHDKLVKMKVGEVSPVIETDYAYYIVKLEGKTNKMPKKLDKEARDKREQEIEQYKLQQAQMKFEKKLLAMQKVEIFDPEFEAYWTLAQARSPMGERKDMQKAMADAAISLKKAIKEKPNNYFAKVKLAQLYSETGKEQEALQLLYPMLEGEEAVAEGADLRVLLGDLLLKDSKKDKALEQYKIASDIARNDFQTHQQLLMKFQQLEQTELVEKEKQWIENYQKQMMEQQKMAEEAAKKADAKSKKSTDKTKK